MNIAKICKASGFSRPTIRRAIDKGELKSFPYANQVCVMRTEYVRWVNSIGQAAP
jgi:predicted DNA-binding transcriptional regulator AlpA